MFLRSKTGLLEGVRKPVQRRETVSSAEFPNFVRPAPYTLRPFAGVYNPFPYGCSILCNHPADCEAKDIVKRAKDSWATEGKALLLPEEIAAIRTGFLQGSLPPLYDDGEDAVPEELFRRYTDTDSRPLTPAPTLASIMTRGSLRRCVTPEPIPTHILNPTRERTVLLLDLRRSHSQGILSWQGLDVPQPQSRSLSPVQTGQDVHIDQKKKISMKKKGKNEGNDKNINQKLQQQQLKTLSVPSDTTDIPTDMSRTNDEEEMPKRRGKHRHRQKKSGRDGSREPEEFQGLAEPGETQVSALVSNLENISAQPSSTSGAAPREVEVEDNQQVSSVKRDRPSLGGNSFIDAATLKQLQRELDQDVIDSEFNPKRCRALKEAVKSCPEKKPPMSEEMKQLKCEMRQHSSAIENLLTLPRNFSRRSSRFELPLDSRLLNTMTPMQYVQRYIHISSGRRQLYNTVFNRHKAEVEDETERRILGQNVVGALGEVMGRPLSGEQLKYIRDLIGWEDSDLLEFRTWCGLCALCERLLAPKFINLLPSRLTDPCHEVEQADFETLPQRLHGLHPDPRLVTILNGIWNL